MTLVNVGYRDGCDDSFLLSSLNCPLGSPGEDGVRIGSRESREGEGKEKRKRGGGKGENYCIALYNTVHEHSGILLHVSIHTV